VWASLLPSLCTAHREVLLRFLVHRAGNTTCERLGLEFPVSQAGMGWVARGELAAAVSAAGGLGVIGAGVAASPRQWTDQCLLALAWSGSSNPTPIKWPNSSASR
jgi:hypothetical protein